MVCIYDLQYSYEFNLGHGRIILFELKASHGKLLTFS